MTDGMKGFVVTDDKRGYVASCTPQVSVVSAYAEPSRSFVSELVELLAELEGELSRYDLALAVTARCDSALEDLVGGVPKPVGPDVPATAARAFSTGGALAPLLERLADALIQLRMLLYRHECLNDVAVTTIKALGGQEVSK